MFFVLRPVSVYSSKNSSLISRFCNVSKNFPKYLNAFIFTFLFLSCMNFIYISSNCPVRKVGGHTLDIRETCSTHEFLTSSSLSSPRLLSRGKISWRNQFLLTDFHTLFRFAATFFLTSSNGSIASDLISLTMNFSQSSLSSLPATLFKICRAVTLAFSSSSS